MFFDKFTSRSKDAAVVSALAFLKLLQVHPRIDLPFCFLADHADLAQIHDKRSKSAELDSDAAPADRIASSRLMSASGSLVSRQSDQFS